VNEIIKEFFYKIINKILFYKNESTIAIKIAFRTKKLKKYNNVFCLIQSDRTLTIKKKFNK